jgi:Protein of unknown function (DUF1203)
MSFRITGLPAEHFTELFALSDDELAARGAMRRIADRRMPGYPCRVSLTRLPTGRRAPPRQLRASPRRVALPHALCSLRAQRRGSLRRRRSGAEQLRLRTLAVRAFDADAMMLGWDLLEGTELESAIERLFTDPRAAYLHIHFAAPVCYAARVERV